MASLKVAEDLKNFIRDLLYPVGTIYICDNETNPGTRFGGTWVMVPSGHLFSQTAGGALMSTGGGTTTGSTAITLAQMAAHVHWFNRDTNWAGEHSHKLRRDTHGVEMGIQAGADSNIYGNSLNGNWSSVKIYSGSIQPEYAGNHYHNIQGDTDSRGSNQGHTHTFQPLYVTVRCWRRTT